MLTKTGLKKLIGALPDIPQKQYTKRTPKAAELFWATVSHTTIMTQMPTHYSFPTTADVLNHGAYTKTYNAFMNLPLTDVSS